MRRGRHTVRSTRSLAIHWLPAADSDEHTGARRWPACTPARRRAPAAGQPLGPAPAGPQHQRHCKVWCRLERSWAHLVHRRVDLDVHVVTKLVVGEVGGQRDEARLPAHSKGQAAQQSARRTAGPASRRRHGPPGQRPSFRLLPTSCAKQRRHVTCSAARPSAPPAMLPPWSEQCAPVAAREHVARTRAVALTRRHGCSSPCGSSGGSDSSEQQQQQQWGSSK